MRKSEVEIKEVRAMVEKILEKYPLSGNLILRTLNWALGEDDDFFEKSIFEKKRVIKHEM